MNPSGTTASHGGEGVQQSLLARAFAERGHNVHMLSLDHGQPDEEVIDGVRLWKTYRKAGGLPVFRFIYPRAFSLMHALRCADADVYYQSSAGMLTGLTAWFCQRNKRKFVYRVASDSDCIPGQQLIQFWRDRKLYEWGLRRANLTLSQSEQQRSLLRNNYGLDSKVAGMPVETCEVNRTFKERTVDVLWVNNIRPVKQPERLLALAQQLDSLNFTQIGGPAGRSQSLFLELQDKATDITNLNWRGYVPYSQTRKVFEEAKLFISTSDMEGFPNTYLQAWMAGTPVVAFFDPDGIIQREGLGRIVGSLDEAKEAITGLLENETEWRRINERVRAYASRHHGTPVIDQYEQLFASLTTDKKSNAFGSAL